MTCVVIACGTEHLLAPYGDFGAAGATAGIERLSTSAIPTRQELKDLDALAARALPSDPTPSLDDIAAQPDVSHLGTPALAPQRDHLLEPLRVVVVGTDAALSAVLTRMMRGDYLWAEVGYVPVDASLLATDDTTPSGSASAGSLGAASTVASTAAQNWGLPTDFAEALEFALRAPVNPAPLIRNDAGIAVAGSATIADWDNAQVEGEIIVDDAVITHPDTHPGYGVRLVPTLSAPGLLAARAITPFDAPLPSHTPLPDRTRVSLFDKLRDTFRNPLGGRPHERSRDRLRGRLLRKKPGQLDPDSVLTGRAVQAGGVNLRVTIDGVSAKRPVKRSTFYRHLRDLQIVR